MKKSGLALGLGLAVGLSVLAAAASAQHSPAPAGPAESGLKTNRGGTIPPAPGDASGRFSPNPPPPMPGTEETPPAGKVKTEEKVGTPTAGTPAAGTPAPTMNPKMTPTRSGSAAKTTPRPTPRAGKVTPKATPSPKSS